mgnify:CR=1 FL=1
MAHTPSCLRVGLYACISLYPHGVVLRKEFLACVFGPSSGAERLDAKNISDEDHDAILEETGRREGLDHDEEASLGDASGDGSSSSSEEEDGNNQV